MAHWEGEWGSLEGHEWHTWKLPFISSKVEISVCNLKKHLMFLRVQAI